MTPLRSSSLIESRGIRGTSCSVASVMSVPWQSLVRLRLVPMLDGYICLVFSQWEAATVNCSLEHDKVFTWQCHSHVLGFNA